MKLPVKYCGCYVGEEKRYVCACLPEGNIVCYGGIDHIEAYLDTLPSHHGFHFTSAESYEMIGVESMFDFYGKYRKCITHEGNRYKLTCGVYKSTLHLSLSCESGFVKLHEESPIPVVYMPEFGEADKALEEYL